MRSNTTAVATSIRDYAAERQTGQCHTLKCECGGWLSFGTNVLTGMMYECCSGACGYIGKARPATDRPLVITPIDRAVVRDCVDGCGRKASSGFATRCNACRRVHRLREMWDHNTNSRWKEKQLRALDARAAV